MLEDVAIHADDAVLGTRPKQRIRIRNLGAGRAIICHQHSKCIRPRLATQTHSVGWIRDASREHKFDWSLEEACILQEEWALLWEEHFVSLVDRHLRLVGFHLAEIRIGGEVEGERVVEHNLCARQL